MSKRLIVNIFLLSVILTGVVYQLIKYSFFPFYFILINLFLLLNINFPYQVSKLYIQFKNVFDIKNSDEIVPSDFIINLFRYGSLVAFIVNCFIAYYGKYYIH